MAKKDDILSSFLKHELLRTKYELEDHDTKSLLREALNSPKPIVKAIALIVDGLEAPQPLNDNALRNLILQYLNEKAI